VLFRSANQRLYDKIAIIQTLGTELGVRDQRICQLAESNARLMEQNDHLAKCLERRRAKRS
jgi:hypothetical protein